MVAKKEYCWLVARKMGMVYHSIKKYNRKQDASLLLKKLSKDSTEKYHLVRIDN